MGAKGTPEPAAALNAASAVDRLCRGEISMDEYVDECVEEGTRHLQGKISAHRLAVVRQVIREQMETDPALADYVAKMVGFARASRLER